MAMTGTGMSAAIKSALTGLGWFGGDADSQAAQQEFCDAIGDAVVSYIQSSATVLPTLLFAPGGSGGPVTGTGTVT